MEELLNVTKSIGVDVPVPMATRGNLPMIRKGSLEVADRLVGVF